MLALLAMVANITFAQETVDNIAAFKALDKNTTAVLTLKEAQVVYKNEFKSKSGSTTTEYYVRDASGAIQFYNTGLNLAEGQVLNGTIEGKYSPYNGTPELAKTDNTSAENLTITEGTVTPTSVTVADLQDDKYICDLIVVKGKLTEEESGNYKNYYVSDGDNKVMVYDKFKTGVTIPSDGNEYEVKGVLVSAKLSDNIVYEISPLSINTATGINTINTTVSTENGVLYNVAGQRVNNDYKGLVIMNGKKLLKK